MSWPGRVGWCPSVVTPMAASDGLLVRVKPTAATLPAAALRAVAEAAEKFGNGLIDLTNRGNLQVRGLRPETADVFASVVQENGLASTAPSLEEIRNVAADPLGRDDPEAVFDSHAIARSIEAMLAATRALRALPPKFGFLVDCSRLMPVAETHADIVVRDRNGTLTISLGGGQSVLPCTPGEAPDFARRLALAFLDLAGASTFRMHELVEAVGERAVLAKAGFAASADWVPDQVRDTGQGEIARLGEEGTADRQKEPRVPDLIRDPEAAQETSACGAIAAPASPLSKSCPGVPREATSGDAVSDSADGGDEPGHDDLDRHSDRVGGTSQSSTATAHRSRTADQQAQRRVPDVIRDPQATRGRTPDGEPDDIRAAHLALMYAPAPADSPIGHIPFRRRNTGAVVAGAPRGRIEAAALAKIADLSSQYADGTVRVTPWRALAFAPVSSDNAPALLADLGALGLITDPADPRRALRGPDIEPASAATLVRPETTAS